MCKCMNESENILNLFHEIQRTCCIFRTRGKLHCPDLINKFHIRGIYLQLPLEVLQCLVCTPFYTSRQTTVKK